MTIQPLLQGDALLQDILQAAEAPDRLHLWWLGQSGFLVQHRGRHLLLDPYLSDSLTRKYAATDKPHVRMTDLAVAPARLDFVDVVTASHAHTDHLDPETLRPLAEASQRWKLVAPAAEATLAAERSGLPADRIVLLDEGRQAELHGIHMEAAPSAHESIDRDLEGRCRFLGFIIRWGDWTLYHSGDTVDYPGLAERLRPHQIDIALLPINGRSPERRVAGNLWGDEAARLAKQIGARWAIPCHYEMFAFNTATPELFLQEAQRIGQPVAVLKCGQRWTAV